MTASIKDRWLDQDGRYENSEELSDSDVFQLSPGQKKNKIKYHVKLKKKSRGDWIS